MNPYKHFYKHQKFFGRLDRLRIKSWHWISISLIVAVADFLSDASIQFPILYVFPIALAGWYGKRNHAYILAIILPCLRFILHLMWDAPWIVTDTIINIFIRIVVFTILTYFISFAKELNVLKGLLHVCSYCGCIKNDDGSWIPIQEYIINHSEAMLSHGICPDCVPKFIQQQCKNK